MDNSIQKPRSGRVDYPNSSKSIIINYDEDYKKERQALVDIYEALSGDSWFQRSNWKTSESIFNWYGVKPVAVTIATKDGNLTYYYVGELNLSFNNLHGHIKNGASGALPESIANLKHLTKLNLSHNHLVGPLPSSLFSLPKLEVLNLEFNQLNSGAFPGRKPVNGGKNGISGISGLKNTLTELTIDHNRLKGEIAELAELKRLKKLHIYENNFYGQIPDEMAEMSALTQFRFYHNFDLKWSKKVQDRINKEAEWESGELSSTQATANVGSVKEDLIGYIPQNLRIVEEAGGKYLLTDGRSRMKMFACEEDAMNARIVAMRHNKQGFVGRGNKRANRKDYIFEYWVGNSGIPPQKLSKQDLISYNPNNLAAVSMGDQGWSIRDGNHMMFIADNEADAKAIISILKNYTKVGFIGRDNKQPDRKNYIMTYLE